VVECHHPVTVVFLSGLSIDLRAEKIAKHEDVYVFLCRPCLGLVGDCPALDEERGKLLA
jgi:hypothetical protein